MRGVPIRLSVNNGAGDEPLPIYVAGVQIKFGGVFRHISSGGGGYGDPLEREPQSVLEDVLDGFVSMDGARDEYGVVIHANAPELLDHKIDYAATKALREQMRLMRRGGILMPIPEAE
jgi:N-methylhydantoinase B